MRLTVSAPGMRAARLRQAWMPYCRNVAQHSDMHRQYRRTGFGEVLGRGRSMGHRDGAAAPTAWARIALVLTVSLQPLIVSCTSILPDQAGSLSSYASLEPSDGLLTSARVSVNEGEILSARTVRISPTAVWAAAASAAGVSEPQARLIANAVDRSLCTGLSRRFQIASAGQPADLSVRAFITRIVPDR